MTQVKKLDFTGITIFCGVDVHKKNWRVNIQDGEFELEDFSQDPDPFVLYRHVQRKYPGASFKICYEAGFCGFGTQRWFTEQGINCQVVNAADVATTHKEKRQKNDKIDARKLCDHLQSKKMKGIYVPQVDWEQGRCLVRVRSKIVSNQTRCKNRIWQLLHSNGLALPKGYEAGQYWSKHFINELQAIICQTEWLKTALEVYIKDYQQTKSLLLETTRAIRRMCRQPEFKDAIKLLRTIGGIGEVNAAVFLFELQDVNRFKGRDHLKSYAGLVPDTNNSGETQKNKGITYRANHYLRTALVESSWSVIRKDPALLMMYKKYSLRMEKNRAIIRIAGHLLSRINYVLKTKKEYVPGVVA